MSDAPHSALDLPAPDTSPLADAPLDVVVCQIQYDTTLAVADPRTAQALHSALGGRHGDYAHVEQVQAQTISVGVQPGAAPAVSAAPVAGWRFSAPDGSWVVSVLSDHVSLETSAYATWEDFRGRLEALLTVVKDHLDPGFERRLGLRYIDRLVREGVQQPADWAQYVVPQLLGPILLDGVGPAIRIAQQHLILALDDQETLCGLRHGVLDAGNDAPAYVLDYDIYRETSGRPYDVEAITACVDQFNAYALQLFQASITPEHLKELA